MTEVGFVIEGKYEILKEIGRGGMSVVYLAMDKRLNKQWAVKEIKKNADGGKNEIVVNSLLAEANMMKRLDHAALPRIVDIIDNGITIYIVMDYIEGESLDKILKMEGPQDEETVITWAKQICDALSYLHSQKPPIIYRDMKPANIMLKPEGNIKIIDFGIAREYKDTQLSDTTVLGTKGYAPPEQYSGQTDARSDIYALGMTMHHLLTGIDPRGGEAYASVRQWNPELSEGIEIIIDRCVEPAAENRYQNCEDLLYDLTHPELITSGFKKKQRRKLAAFIVTAIFSVVMLIAGISFGAAAEATNNRDYDLKLVTADTKSYYEAIDIYPERPDAYEKIIEFYKTNGVTLQEIKEFSVVVSKNGNYLDVNNQEIAELYYDIGKFLFSDFDGTLKEKAIEAKPYLEKVQNSEVYFDKKQIAKCYYSICQFVTMTNSTYEHSSEKYREIIDTVKEAMSVIDKATDGEANYDKISLYYTSMLLINGQIEYFQHNGIEKDEIVSLMDELYEKSNSIKSQNNYVKGIQEKISKSYSDFSEKIQKIYDESEKDRGGN